jgi:hypothetical protein
LDSDNGGEFINANLLRYCREREITFTRCRPYKKNDQCHVEQKNWNVVRRTVGYLRYEGPVPRRKLSALYETLRLYQNFFQPSMKLAEKTREGAKVKKRYEAARTPYQRVLASAEVSDEAKAQLKARYLALNPLRLLQEIQRLQEELWPLAEEHRRPPSTLPTPSPAAAPSDADHDVDSKILK